MMKLTLNIYGENDEIIKTFETSHLRWRIFTDAVKLNDEIKNLNTMQQIEIIGDFVRSIFVGMTKEDLELADIGDVFNVFKMVVNFGNAIEGKGKNA